MQWGGCDSGVKLEPWRLFSKQRIGADTAFSAHSQSISYTHPSSYGSRPQPISPTHERKNNHRLITRNSSIRLVVTIKKICLATLNKNGKVRTAKWPGNYNSAHRKLSIASGSLVLLFLVFSCSLLNHTFLCLLPLILQDNHLPYILLFYQASRFNRGEPRARHKDKQANAGKTRISCACDVFYRRSNSFMRMLIVDIGVSNRNMGVNIPHSPGEMAYCCW